MESLQILIEAIDQASKPIQAVADSVEQLNNLSESTKAVGESITSVGENLTGRVTAPVVAGLSAAAWAAIDFESSMADVNKVMGFTEAESAAMGQEILGLTRTLPMSAQGLAEIAAAGGQLGTAKDELGEFTELAAQMSIAFDMTAGLAGQSIGELKNVYGLTLTETELLGDAINHLSNNTASSAGDVVNAAGRIGGVAQTFGLAEAETAALAGTLISFGAAPEVASTAINGMLPMLQTATGQSSRFQDGLAKLGIEAQDLEQAIRQDAMGGLQMYLDALGQLNGSDRANVIQDMFGTGSDAQLLGTLAQNTEVLGQNLELVGEQSAYAGSMQGEFEARAATTANTLQLMKNAFGEILTNIGSGMRPAINDLLGLIIPLSHGFADFAASHPGVVKIGVAIAAVAAAVGPALIVIGQMVSGVGALIGVFAKVKGAMLFLANPAVVGALGSIKSVFVGLATGAAGLAAILGGVVFAIFKISGAVMGMNVTFSDFINMIKVSLMALPANLAMLPAAIGAIFSMIRAKAHAAVIGIITAFRSMVAAMGAVWGAVRAIAVTGVQGVVAAIRGGAANAVGAIRSMGAQMLGAIRAIAGQAFSAGAQIVQRIAEGIRSRVGAVIGAISSVASAVRSALPGSPVDAGPLTVLNNIASNPGAEIVNMLAAGIRSAAPTLQAAMGGVGGAAVTGAGLGLPGVGSGGSSLTLNYSPQITLQGGGEAAREDVIAALREHLPELQSLLEDVVRQQFRVGYG
ncbi:MAG: phage tail tape measure protein [Leptolyngbya sp. SIO4C5]|nr:phage tail tape measure protein [Leptolyngbya sp. SIO4C5]